MKKHISIRHYSSPVGNLVLGAYCDDLCLCDWDINSKRGDRIFARLHSQLSADVIEDETSDVLNEASRQLDEYFERKRFEFDIPFLLLGTDFQKCVWKNLLKIEYGKTSTYKDVAKTIGNEKGVRAVANAIGANALSIFVPCHRVVASDGSLGGYAGGTRAKDALLSLESPHKGLLQFS